LRSLALIIIAIKLEAKQQPILLITLNLFIIKIAGESYRKKYALKLHPITGQAN